MQLATESNDGPWICTVNYVIDDKLNIYWASIPSRLHSKQISASGKTAVAIVVETDLGKGVIGIQAKGTSQLVSNYDEIKPIAQKYAKTFGRTGSWVEKFARSETEHQLYKFTPSKFVLFDDQNHKDSPRIEIELT